MGVLPVAAMPVSFLILIRVDEREELEGPPERVTQCVMQGCESEMEMLWIRREIRRIRRVVAV